MGLATWGKTFKVIIMRTADEEVSRENFTIYRRQKKALKKLDKKSPIKGGMSGHIRIALDRYLELSPDERCKEIPKQFENVIILLEYIKMKIPKNKTASEFELSKGDMMALGFGSYWYQFSPVIELMVHSVGMKKVDVLHEEVFIEKPGSRESVKHERIGYKIVFMVPLTRRKVEIIRDSIESDLKHFGKIRQLPNGDVLGDE